MKIELKLGFTDAQLLAQHNILVQVVSQALGGSKSDSAAPKPDAIGVDINGGVDRAVLNINRMLTFS